MIVFRLLVDCVWWVFGASSLGVFPENRDGRQRRAEGTIAKCKGNISKWFGLIVFRWWLPLFSHYFKPRGQNQKNGYVYKSCGVFYYFLIVLIFPMAVDVVISVGKTMAGDIRQEA